MIGWIVASARASGWRRMCTQAAPGDHPGVGEEESRGPTPGGGPRGEGEGLVGHRTSSIGDRDPAHPGRDRGRRDAFGGRAVRVRNTSSSVGWRSPRSSTTIPRTASSPARAATAPAPPSVGAVMLRVGRSRRGPEASRRRARRTRRHVVEVAGVGADDVELVAAEVALERARVPAGDDAPVVDDDDVVGQAVGLVEVLRRQQDRRAVGHELVQDGPHELVAARGGPA